MTIEYLANLAEIAGGIMIVGGAIFGLVQLRELKQQEAPAYVEYANQASRFG